MSAYINISKKKKKTQTDYWEKKTLGTVATVLVNSCENIVNFVASV